MAKSGLPNDLLEKPNDLPFCKLAAIYMIPNDLNDLSIDIEDFLWVNPNNLQHQTDF
jgi:hypothetical protein